MNAISGRSDDRGRQASRPAEIPRKGWRDIYVRVRREISDDNLKTYGSLGVVVVLMMWFFVSVYAVLIGAEINAEMEHQTVKDTTAGAGKPMGQRGCTSPIRSGGRRKRRKLPKREVLAD